MLLRLRFILFLWKPKQRRTGVEHCLVFSVGKEHIETIIITTFLDRHYAGTELPVHETL